MGRNRLKDSRGRGRDTEGRRRMLEGMSAERKRVKRKPEAALKVFGAEWHRGEGAKDEHHVGNKVQQY